MEIAPETLTIASRLECIDDARQWVTARVRSAGFGDEPVSEIELALTEALANVMEHSYEGDTTKEIAVTVVGDDHSLRISVRDWGKSFDPAGYSPRDLDDPGEGGYGVFLIDELMDRVIREPQPDGGTLLTLVKRKEGDQHG